MSYLQNFSHQVGFGYVADIDSAYGQKDGYTILVSRIAPENTYVIFFSIQEAKGIQTVLNQLKEEHSSISQADYKDHRVLITVMLHDSNELEAIINQLVESLKEQEIVQVCSMSGREDDLGVYRVMNRMDVFNRETFEQYDHQLAQDYAGKKTNVLAGVVGALAGAALGGVVWVLVGQLNFIVGMIGLLIVYLSVKGYEFLGGRIDRKAIYIVTAISLFMVVFAEYVSYVIVAYREYGNYLTLGQTMSFVLELITSEPQIRNSFLFNAGLGLIFTIVASFNFLRANLNQTSVDYQSQRLL